MEGEKAFYCEAHSHLMNRIWFVFHEIKTNPSVCASPPMDVSELEKIKSTFMAIVFESELGEKDQEGLMDEIQRIWSDIYGVLGLHKEKWGLTPQIRCPLRNPAMLSKLLPDKKA